MGEAPSKEDGSTNESKNLLSEPSGCCDKPGFLAIKAFYFFFIGALGSVAPFLAILFKQFGLTPQQIGAIFGIRPVVGFISGPLWGAIADKFNIRRVLLMISLLFWIGAFLAVAFVPPPRLSNECPDNLKPHRQDLLHKKENKSTETNLTSKQLAIIRENYGWIYDPVDLHRILTIFLILIIVGEFAQSPTTALSDAATLELLGQDQLHAYGYQRAFGPLGWAVTSVTVGFLISQTRVTEIICGVPLYFSNFFDYSYVFGSFMLCAIICAALIPFGEKSAKKKKVPTATLR